MHFKDDVFCLGRSSPNYEVIRPEYARGATSQFMNDRLFCCQFFQPKADQPQADKVRRSSRSDSLFLMLSRLSYFFLPRTVAIKTFILTLLLYIERGTIVN